MQDSAGFKIIRLIWSVTIVYISCILSLFAFKKQNLIFIGSNYGREPDPNALGLADYAARNNFNVLTVSFASSHGRRVGRGSWNCVKLIFQCEAVYCTHGFSDIVPFGHKIPFLLKLPNIPKIVFIQHGVIGLKSKVDESKSLAYYLLSIEKAFHYMVVSSQREKQIIAGLGIQSEKIAITGLPRFDLYRTYSPREKKDVLIFFTWQSVDAITAKVSELKNSKGLRLLENQGYTLHWMEHNMQKIPTAEESGPQSIDHLVATGAVLITDESSVAWDFLYRNASVIFYKPRSEWLIQSDKALNSMVANSIDAFNQQVISLISPNSPSRGLSFATYHDRKNCERTLALGYRKP